MRFSFLVALFSWIFTTLPRVNLATGVGHILIESRKIGPSDQTRVYISEPRDELVALRFENERSRLKLSEWGKADVRL